MKTPPAGKEGQEGGEEEVARCPLDGTFGEEIENGRKLNS
jgi:hypothetical protein